MGSLYNYGINMFAIDEIYDPTDYENQYIEFNLKSYL